MTTTTTAATTQNITVISDKKVTDFLNTLQAEHSEASALVKLISEAQAKIDASAPYVSQDRTRLSYYAPVARYHAGQIEKYTTIRNDLINKYTRLAWKLYSKDLPIFSTPDFVLLH